MSENNKDNSFTIDRSKDLEMLEKTNARWKDIDQLKENLLTPLKGRAEELDRILDHQINLFGLKGEDLSIVDGARKSMKNDIRNFKDKCRSISTKYAGKSGKITTIDDHDLYSNVSMQFMIASDEYRDLTILNMGSLESVIGKYVEVPKQPEMSSLETEEIILNA